MNAVRAVTPGGVLIVLLIASAATDAYCTAVAADNGGSTSQNAIASAERRFSLIDQHGQPVSAADLRGRWLVVFFGFTRCPEVCPTTLALLSSALRSLGADSRALQAVLITLDPQHDTPQILASYLQGFGSGFMGLTGTPEQVSAAAASFGAYSSRIAQTAGSTDTLSHSSTLYLIDPYGRLHHQFSSALSAGELAAYLQKAVRSQRGAAFPSSEGS